MSTIFDIIILGGGPAGCAAAVYAARKKMTTMLLTETFGGQSVVSETIYNWIGTPEISGNGLAQSLESHVRYYSDISVQTGYRVLSVSRSDDGIFTVTAVSGSDTQTWQSRTVLYALGSSRKRLTAPGADLFEHKGLTYCASCDGPLFSGQPVAVIGGGNAGFESAMQLLAYCSHVTLIHRNSTFRADEISVRAATAHPNFTAVINATINEVIGEKFVSAIRYTTPESGEVTLPVAGIFVEIGQLPNTDPLQPLKQVLNDHNHVVTDPRTGRTTLPGLYAAGDCTDCLYHQNNIAAGDAVRALEDLYLWLQRNR